MLSYYKLYGFDNLKKIRYRLFTYISIQLKRVRSVNTYFECYEIKIDTDVMNLK